MTVNARSEMDLEEDTILDKVAKASGANFGFHKEKARPMPEQGPVVGDRDQCVVPALTLYLFLHLCVCVCVCGAGVSIPEG